MNKTSFDYLIPEWPAPDNVQAVITFRTCAQSQGPYQSFNLATHVGDDPQQVEANRNFLKQQLKLQKQPVWLNQVHGTEVIQNPVSGFLPAADGCFSEQLKQPCVVLTADCLPILLCNQQGTQVAAVHAGWRGLCGGIIRNALNCFSAMSTVIAYLGPAISAKHFEVGPEVLVEFLSNAINNQHRAEIQKAFVKTTADRYLADLYALARAELNNAGVNDVFGGDFCSFSQFDQFYSYRRDKNCGRNASLIWRKSL